MPGDGLLRFNAAGEAALITACDADRCFVDECVPAGTFEYGLKTPIVAALFPGRRLRLAVTCAVATTATHLLMHFAFPGLLPRGASPFVAGEVFATVAEAIVYLAVSREAGRALVASALANSASLAAGLVLFG